MGRLYEFVSPQPGLPLEKTCFRGGDSQSGSFPGKLYIGTLTDSGAFCWDLGQFRHIPIQQ